MNEYKRGYQVYATGYLTEQPEHLYASLLGSLRRLATATERRHQEVWTDTALFYLGAILGQQERGSWQELAPDNTMVTHTA